MIEITRHAEHRARSRLGMKPGSLRITARNAYQRGIRHFETTDSLNRYLTKLWFYNQRANNIRVHGDAVFVFSSNVLVTVYRLPEIYLPQIKQIKEKIYG